MRHGLMIGAAFLSAAAPALADDVIVTQGISLNGSVQMGFAYGPVVAPTGSDARLRLITDLDATVHITHELDNGLTIGVVFDLPDIDE